MEPILVQFFELKYKQLLLSALLSVHKKPSKPEDDTDIKLRESDVGSKKEVNDEALGEFINANLETLKQFDVNVEAKKPEYRLSKERQEELSRQEIGLDLNLDSLYKLLQRKGLLR